MPSPQFYIVDLKDSLDDSDDLDEEADGSDTDAYTEHSDDSDLDEPIGTDQYWTGEWACVSKRTRITHTAYITRSCVFVHNNCTRWMWL